MKKAAIFENQLNNLVLDVYHHFLELIKHKNSITIETDDVLTVYIIGEPQDVYPLKVTDNGVEVKIEVCLVEQKNRQYKVYFSDLLSIEDKLLLISLMEDNLTTGIDSLGNLKEVGGTFNPNEI
jgi:hypothetical protein